MKRIRFHQRAIKFLHKIPKKEAHRVIEKVKELGESTTSSLLDVKKLLTTKNMFRLRVGTIRIIFTVDVEANTLYVLEIDFRGNIY